MSSRLIIEIANLFDLIEQKENEHQSLITSGADDCVLQESHGNIENLKLRLKALEDLLYDDSLPEK